MRQWRGRPYRLQTALERGPLAAAVDLAAPRPTFRWLDVATGTGELLRALALRSDRPRVAIGIDASPSMLAQVPALPVGWRVREGDARALPFANASFDVVSLAYLVHLLGVADRRAVLREAARVLRPEGRVLTVTVAATVPAAHAALARLPAWSGLRALDPRQDLLAAGLRPARGRFARGGWPSLCVLAAR